MTITTIDHSNGASLSESVTRLVSEALTKGRVTRKMFEAIEAAEYWLQDGIALAAGNLQPGGSRSLPRTSEKYPNWSRCFDFTTTDWWLHALVIIHPLIEQRQSFSVVSIEVMLRFSGLENRTMDPSCMKPLVFLGNYIMASFFLDVMRNRFTPWLFNTKQDESTRVSESKEKYMASIVSSLKSWQRVKKSQVFVWLKACLYFVSLTVFFFFFLRI